MCFVWRYLKGSSDQDVLSNESKSNERCNYILPLHFFFQVTRLTFSNEERVCGPVAGQVTGEAEKHSEENRWAGRVWTDSGDFVLMHASEAEPGMFGNRDTQVENNQNGFYFVVFLSLSTLIVLCAPVNLSSLTQTVLI